MDGEEAPVYYRNTLTLVALLSFLEFTYRMCLCLNRKMVRHYKRKTQRATRTSKATLLRAAFDVQNEHCSLRHAADNYGIDKMTLMRFIRKLKFAGIPVHAPPIPALPAIAIIPGLPSDQPPIPALPAIAIVPGLPSDQPPIPALPAIAIVPGLPSDQPPIPALPAIVRADAQQTPVAHAIPANPPSTLEFNALVAKSSKLKTGYVSRQVFSDFEEQNLVDYLIKASQLYFGLQAKEVRELAYEYAKTLGKTCLPEKWAVSNSAGRDWFSTFMSRHSGISLRTPESTSLGRASAFNEFNVKAFFSNLNSVYVRHSFGAENIWNCDETGMTTVQRPSKVIAATGVKQVGAITSAERGQLVTVCCAVNAMGHAIPPFFILPRVRYNERFVREGPVGSVGAAHKSGWMTKENFMLFLRHFVRYSKCTPTLPTLLLLDNHESHISIEAVQFSKDNGVVMLSFPPHCSHKLQPLDLTVYGPLKRYYNSFSDAWCRNHPGQPMNTLDIPGLLRQAFPLAMTPSNIQAGFRAAGIFPYNPHVFTDDEFLPARATDRPEPVNEVMNIEASTATNAATPLPSSSTDGVLPEHIKPFPKAGPRKATKFNGRKKGRTMVLTDTPIKLQRELEHQSSSKNSAQDKGRPIRGEAVKRRLAAIMRRPTSDDRPRPMPEMCDDDSDDDYDFHAHRRDEDEIADFVNQDKIEVGAYVLVQFSGKKSKAYYVGQVKRIDGDNIETHFMRRSDMHKGTIMSFNFQDDDIGISIHARSDIVLKLPLPSYAGGTKRCVGKHIFSCDLSMYDPL
jgi:hypothetical protein